MRVPLVSLPCEGCEESPRLSGKKYCADCSAVFEETMEKIKTGGLGGALQMFIQEAKLHLNEHGSTRQLDEQLETIKKLGERITKVRIR